MNRESATVTPGIQSAKDFVDLVDETAEMIRECAELPGPAMEGEELEKVIRNSWSFDEQRRRAAFKGGFDEFRRHVLNVIDAEQDSGLV